MKQCITIVILKALQPIYLSLFRGYQFLLAYVVNQQLLSILSWKVTVFPTTGARHHTSVARIDQM